jgi:hypothetical protein
VKRASVAIAAALLLFAAAVSPTFAQSALSGTWTIQPGYDAGDVQLELRYPRASEPGGSQTSHELSVESLGLRAEDLRGPSHPVHFALRRDAGVLDFTGMLGDGVGAGHYTFSPSVTYPQAISSRGIDAPDVDHQLAAVLLDVSLSYTDSIIALGIRPSSFDKLIAFRALRISPESIRGLRRAFGMLNEEDLITFTALHITPEYASQMRALGLAIRDPHTLVSLKALHIDAAYVHELASLGYDHLSAEDLTQMKAMHIDADYIRRVQSHGYKHPSIEQLVQLKALHII